MEKIEKLTEAQTARFSEYRNKWTEIGLSTAPADRPRAEAAINDIYRVAGLPPPQKIIWCGSPMSQGLTRAIILDKSVGASVRDSVGASVWASVRDSVGDSVRASVWASVGDSVRDSVGDSVWASVGDSVRDSVRASVWASGFGQHDAGWLAFYAFLREVVGLTTITDKLKGLTEQAKSAGWFIPHEHICWVSERHNVLMRDGRGRLHALSGPACAYPDGWAIYAVHGVRVPSDIIEDRTSITVERIEKETNAEVRRVMIELYGQSRYLTDSGAKEIHSDDFGTLYRADIPNDEPLVMVKVVNSTAEPDGHFKDYFIRVPPTVTTAREAVAWTFGKTADEYAPLIET